MNSGFVGVIIIVSKHHAEACRNCYKQLHHSKDIESIHPTDELIFKTRPMLLLATWSFAKLHHDGAPEMLHPCMQLHACCYTGALLHSWYFSAKHSYWVIEIWAPIWIYLFVVHIGNIYNLLTNLHDFTHQFWNMSFFATFSEFCE